jgi:hypothetical protein
VPETVEAVPTEQRLVVGFEVVFIPLDDPQIPLTLDPAEHEAFDPPPVPLHVQVQGFEPKTVEATPTEQRLLVGFEVVPDPLAMPHVPFVRELVELHDQVQGFEPKTVEATPTEQRLLFGIDIPFDPLAEPQTPFTKRQARQVAVVPPFDPLHVHVQGPVPEYGIVVPVKQ